MLSSMERTMRHEVPNTRLGVAHHGHGVATHSVEWSLFT